MDLLELAPRQIDESLLQERHNETEEVEISLAENLVRENQQSRDVIETITKCFETNQESKVEDVECSFTNQDTADQFLEDSHKTLNKDYIENQLQDALESVSGSRDSLQELEQQLFKEAHSTCISPETVITHRVLHCTSPVKKMDQLTENVQLSELSAGSMKESIAPESTGHDTDSMSVEAEDSHIEEKVIDPGLRTEPSVSEKSSKDGKLNIELPPKLVKEPSLLGYFVAELTRGHLLEMEEDRYTERRRKIYTFMKTPRELENLMTFGFFLCLDCFLFVFTYLPLRVMIALFKLFTGLIFWTSRPRLLEPAEICDLLKGAILLVCYMALCYIDFSVLYHLVRGQSVIKLYVVYNMLDIADKLFSSFGQDTLDALFWTATEPRGRKREHFGTLPHFVLSAVYVLFHAGLVLFQAITLNVAINSHNKALLTIMVSNQFVELKGSVFKKFERNNLFQMSCADIRERFYYVILILIVTLRNLTEFNWDIGHMKVLLPDIAMLIISEFFVDWIKHAFITKFNDIPSEVYRDFRAHLAHDMTSSRLCVKARTDHFDLVSRKMGFIPLPLACLLFRVFRQSVRLQGVPGVILAVTAYCCLISIKVLNSIFLLGKACKYVAEEEQCEAERKEASSSQSNSSLSNTSDQAYGSLSSTTLFSRQSLFDSMVAKENDKGKDKKGDPKRRRAKTLAEIDRFTLCTNQIA